MEREQPVGGETPAAAETSAAEKPLDAEMSAAEKPIDAEMSAAEKPGDAQTPASEKPLDAETSAGRKSSGKRKPSKKEKQDKSGLMKRNTAREIAVHLAYELSFTARTAESLLAERLTSEAFASLSEEDPLYAIAPDDMQIRYISRLVSGVSAHGAELDGYIEKYAVGWKFARIPLMASAIMRVAMYEMLYMPEIPNAAAINSAVNIAKKYETPETVRFINGILGSFSRQELA